MHGRAMWGSWISMEEVLSASESDWRYAKLKGWDWGRVNENESGRRHDHKNGYYDYADVHPAGVSESQSRAHASDGHLLVSVNVRCQSENLSGGASLLYHTSESVRL